MNAVRKILTLEAPLMTALKEILTLEAPLIKAVGRNTDLGGSAYSAHDCH